MARKQIEIDESLVKAIGIIVDQLPRNVNKATNVPYKGVLAQEVATTFYALLLKRKHELANERNDKCKFDRPCNSCRRCVLAAHSAEAEKRGLVIRVPRGKDKTVNGKITRVTWVTYYRPGEITLGQDVSALADKVLAML